MIILLSWYFLAQLALAVRGKELSVPSSWNSTVEASREERITRTAEAIDAFIASDGRFTSPQPPSNLSDTYWPHGELLALIANFDIFTNQTRYKRIAQERFLPALQQTKPNLNRYGYAATRAYLAYRDEGFLDIAKDYWASNRSLMLSEEDVKSNSSSAKSKINSTMSLACSKPRSEPYTLAGGTFHSTNETDLLITTGTTADYLTLTVSLANVSSNQDPAYMTSASQMGRFMLHTIYKGSGDFYSNIPVGKPDVGEPDCPHRRNDSHAAVSDAAVAMQALSILGLNTKDDDTADVLREIARRTTGTTWNSADGVLDAQKFPQETGNSVQVSQRLLHSYFHLALGDGASDLRTYLRAYLAIQYDALVKQATFASGVPNLYGPGLRPESQLNAEAQILAITTLLGGVISSDNLTSPNDPRTTEATTPDTGSRGRIPIGAIVGGVIGGVLGLVLAIAGSYYYLRWRRQLQSLPTMDPYPTMIFPISQPPSSAPLPFRSGKYEKRAPPTGPFVAENRAMSSIPPTSESQTSRMQEPTTAELVTILNQRLRNDRWDTNERPPTYR
ncbi:hypothetical protein PQX77_015242 [Marasmius sp. AFHP31]|nr:hypothetical protein PQX77_015242 [Marasmius sp. AFHP31]